MDNNWDFLLKPVFVEGEIQLYDIGEGESWSGSRRTISACKIFMKDRINENIEQLPCFDSHVRLRNAFNCFGKKWYYQIFLEIERREKKEAKA